MEGGWQRSCSADPGKIPVEVQESRSLMELAEEEKLFGMGTERERGEQLLFFLICGERRTIERKEGDDGKESKRWFAETKQI